MAHSIQGRAGLTIQLPLQFLIEITELAKSLNVSRHRMALLALHAGLPAAVEQIRTEAAVTAAGQQSPAAPSKK